MVDLVERLRAADATLTEDNWHTEAKVCREAADEIERLREALLPFAEVAIREDAESPLRVWPDDYWKDDIPINVATNYAQGPEVGDMRRARKVLEGLSHLIPTAQSCAASSRA